MLRSEEKAYCRALVALRRKDYRVASEHFERAATLFGEDRQFNLLRETTRLLLAVKDERTRIAVKDNVEIEEVRLDGKENHVRG